MLFVVFSNSTLGKSLNGSSSAPDLSETDIAVLVVFENNMTTFPKLWKYWAWNQEEPDVISISSSPVVMGIFLSSTVAVKVQKTRGRLKEETRQQRNMKRGLKHKRGLERVMQEHELRGHAESGVTHVVVMKRTQLCAQ